MSNLVVVEEHVKLKIEHEELVSAYEELMRSSKELEAELEYALEQSDKKNDELGRKNRCLEEQLADVMSKSRQSNREYLRTQEEIELLNEHVLELKTAVIQLEIDKDDLQMNVRVLDATVDDLTHKLEIAEEKYFFLQEDTQAIREECESRIEALMLEITQLRIASSSSEEISAKRAGVNDVEPITPATAMVHHRDAGGDDVLVRSKDVLRRHEQRMDAKRAILATTAVTEAQS